MQGEGVAEAAAVAVAAAALVVVVLLLLVAGESVAMRRAAPADRHLQAVFVTL